MKGVILAGGTGSRLNPLTKVTNKHLLPVYNKPMVYYPLQTLLDCGIKDIIIVTGGENIGDFLKLLGSGSELGAKFTYRCQDGSGGIPVALNLAKEFVGKEKFVCILGDNIMENSIKPHVDDFIKSKYSAKIFLQKVPDPKRYGVAEVKGNKVVQCFEKPEKPTTDLAVLGVYMFDYKIFNIIPTLKPSKRGELEIIDVLNHYINKGDLTYSVLDGFWIDAGTFEALHKANRFIAQKESYSNKGPFK